MINHIRTLLFNRNSEQAAASAPWPVDPAFSPLSLSEPVSGVISALFEDSRNDRERAMTVDFCMPFLESPEFDAFRSSFDRRSTVVERRGVPSSVAEFQRSASGLWSDTVRRVVSSDSAQAVFSHVGDADTDAALDSLKGVFLDGMRTWHPFAAVLYAVVFRMSLQASGRVS